MGKGKKKQTARKIRKIIFCGLDNSGKTSFIARLKNQGYPLKPTAGIERSQYDIFGFPILIWDFGGQKKIRDAHLKEIHFFFETDLLFYVIDIQDKQRWDDSIGYFEKLLEVFKEKPLVIVLFHKADPDIAESRSLNADIARLKSKLKEPLKNFKAYYYTSTIFDYLSVLTPFSFALTELLPFSMVLTSYMLNFLDQYRLIGISLLDKNGAQIAGVSAEGKAAFIPFSKLTATNLVTLFEAYEKEGLSPPEINLTIKGELPEKPAGLVLFERLQIQESRYYLLILVENIEAISSVKEAMGEFIQGISKNIELSE